jgi:hypothetical protein
MAQHSTKARTRPWRLALAAAATVALLAVATATATTRIGGNPDALSYYAQVVEDYKHVPGAHVVQYGLFFLHYNGGTSVDYRWGSNKPAGFKAAKAVTDFWLKDGKIVGYLSTVTARDVPRLRVLVAAGNVYVSTTTCWTRANAGSAPFGTGERLLVSDNNGVFEALKHNGRSTIVTYRYVWSDGTNAKEVATLTGNPPRIQSKVVTKGAVKLKVSYSVKPLGRRPALPLKSRGSLKPPVPSPFCTN